ncbi:type II secretion system protein [Paenibacillus sp. sgz302251]|uniref:type II secretion system protein n=1 Tax=Paenibacillus sp. sgz302251 TaxID=3414493 RepID=UPI003C79E7C0
MQMVLKRLKKEQKGFTLIELLAVIVILSVIAVIAVPLVGNIIDNTKEDADVATARQVYNAARLYVTAEQAGDFADKKIPVVGNETDGLVGKGYLEQGILLPSTKAPITGGTVTFNVTGALVSVTLTTGTEDEVAEGASTDTSKYYAAADVLTGGQE